MNIWRISRSELLSTFFPTWIWQGRMWFKWRIPNHGPYWINTHAHPVLSTYYPVHAVSSAIGSLLSLNNAFNLLLAVISFHFIWMFIAWYKLFGLFGAIAFTFQACHIRQQPCIVYTLAWFPWMILGLTRHDFVLSSISIGMILLSGYYPLAIYLLPVSLFFGQWLSIVMGFLIGLPQLIPFLRYLPKTIRGSVEAPSDSPTEKQFYVGIVPIILLLTNLKWSYLWILAPMTLMLIRSNLFRISKRAMILSCYLSIWYAVQVIQLVSPIAYLLLTLIHAFDLWIHNKELIPPRPYVELYQKPSRAFNNRLTEFLEQNATGRVAGLPYPLFTGLINNIKSMGYCGSMQNKLMYKWRKSFNHNPFIDGVEESDIIRYRVEYAYSRKKLDWDSTPIKHLYRNPAYC